MDETIRSLLEPLAKGDLTVLGPLADRFEELGGNRRRILGDFWHPPWLHTDLRLFEQVAPVSAAEAKLWKFLLDLLELYVGRILAMWPGSPKVEFPRRPPYQPPQKPKKTKKVSH